MRSLAPMTLPADGAWLWLEELTDAIGPRWPVARYALAARHLAAFSGTYVSGRETPSWPWLGSSSVRTWLPGLAPSVAQLRVVLKDALVRRAYPADIAEGLFRLWDEQRRKLVGFRHLKALQRS